VLFRQTVVSMLFFFFGYFIIEILKQISPNIQVKHSSNVASDMRLSEVELSRVEFQDVYNFNNMLPIVY